MSKGKLYTNLSNELMVQICLSKPIAKSRLKEILIKHVHYAPKEIEDEFHFILNCHRYNFFSFLFIIKSRYYRRPNVYKYFTENIKELKN